MRISKEPQQNERSVENQDPNLVEGYRAQIGVLLLQGRLDCVWILEELLIIPEADIEEREPAPGQNRIDERNRHGQSHERRETQGISWVISDAREPFIKRIFALII